jgi:TolA-binding protein
MDQWDWMAATGMALIAGVAAGYFWSQQGVRTKTNELRKRVAQLEQTRKAAGERIAQMRDQIMGLNKTVAELRQAQSRLEAEKRRREMVERAFQQSPFEQNKPGHEAAARKDPPATFADTEVLE